MSYSKFRAAAVASTLFASYLGLATSAYAELCPPDLTLTNQQNGVCITDRVATRVLYQTASEASAQELFVAIAGIPVLPNFTAGLVFLTEPVGTPAEPGGFPGLNLSGVTIPGNLSDVLALRLDIAPGSGIDLAYLSDGAAAPDVAVFNTFAAGLPLLGSLTETGAWQDVSSFFGVAAGSVLIQSDVEFTQPGIEVPEPASLALLGTALLGFTAIRRRKQV